MLDISQVDRSDHDDNIFYHQPYRGEGRKHYVESVYPALEAMFFMIKKDGKLVRYIPSGQEFQNCSD
jgi:hypothetical protein